MHLRRSKTENLLNLIGLNLGEATPAINVQQKTLCRSKTTTNHDHFASGARSDGTNNLTFFSLTFIFGTLVTICPDPVQREPTDQLHAT